MNLLSDIITYVRRIVKTPNESQLTDALIIDYINRFWINDVDARIQLFDLKTTYQFQTQPGFDRYNMPLYSIQIEPGNQNIGYYPVYQGFMNPIFVNGIQIPMFTDKTQFFNSYPNVVQDGVSITQGNGTSGPYIFSFPILPNNTQLVSVPYQYILRGHVDIGGILAFTNFLPPMQDPIYIGNGNLGGNFIEEVPTANSFPAVYITSNTEDGESIVVADSGMAFDSVKNYGILMNPGGYPKGNSALPNGYLNNYTITGATQASPCVLTATTNFGVGHRVTISGVGGMTELNGNTYTVSAVDATTVTINVDSTNFTAYTTGGTITGYFNYIDYLSGEVNVTFPQPIPAGVEIYAQYNLFQSGIPQSVLFYDNTLQFRAPPDRQYKVEVEAYLTPAAYLNTSDYIQYGYMSEYIARGAARKILSDTGDIEQFSFYEPLFKEQEMLVWKRAQRQFTSNRTQTIYSRGVGTYGGQII